MSDQVRHPGGLVIVGASLAGLRAAEAARREGYAGPVTLLGAEAHLPYDRPPLSKGFLSKGDEPTYFRSAQELVDLEVQTRLGDAAVRLDPDAREVHTSAGAVVPFDRLLIATGSSPRRLEHFRDLDGVVTLRTLDEALALRSRLHSARDVVVVGAGFIGSEIASSVAQRGARVTVLEAAQVPLVRAVGEVVGAAISALHPRYGTRLICDARIEELIGVDRVKGVRLAGGETIAADVVVVGIGSAPATGWLGSSGVATDSRDGGVLCDEFLESSIRGVFAAGDVACWPNALFGQRMRLENWTSAAEQASRAVTNALFPERRQPHVAVPYFWTDWYGHRIQFVGTAIAEHVEFVSGSPGEERFIALYRSEDRIVGAATVDEQRWIMKYRALIARSATWAEAVDLTHAASPAGRLA